MLSVFGLYLCLYLYQYFTSQVHAVTNVSTGVMDLTNLESGIIIRDETIYKNTQSGNIVYKAQNKQKVAKGAEVLLIVDETSNESNSYTIKQGSIYDYEENYLLYEDEIKNNNVNIKKYIDSSNVTSFRELYLLKDYIENELNARNTYLITGSQDVLQESYVAKERLLSATSGIVSYNIDGYEEIITYGNLDNINENYTNMMQEKKSFTSRQTVLDDEILFKTINSNTWHIVSYIDNSRMQDIKVNTYHKLFLETESGFIDIWFYVESIDKEGDKSKVVFKTTKRITDFLEYRNIKFKLFDEVYHGLKIPVSAIKQKDFIAIKSDYIYQDNQFYVLVESGENNFLKVPINIWLVDNEIGVAYLDPNQNEMIKVGDILISNEKEEVFQIQNLTSIDGVLKVNNGFAEFKPIVIEENIPEDREVTILNTKKNKYIKEHDKIITYSNEIEDGERVSR